MSVSPPWLTFTASNWNSPRSVTVSAADDVTSEGNHTGTITHRVISRDPKDDSIGGDSITVEIADNDPGVLLQESERGTEV